MPFRSDDRSSRLKKVDAIIDFIVGFLLLIAVILICIYSTGCGAGFKSPRVHFTAAEVDKVTLDTKKCHLSRNGEFWVCDGAIVRPKPTAPRPW